MRNGTSICRVKMARQADFQSDISRPSLNVFFLSRRTASKSRLPLVQHPILYSKWRYLFNSVYQRWRISHCKESIEIYICKIFGFFFFTLIVPDEGDSNYRRTYKRCNRERYLNSRKTVLHGTWWNSKIVFLARYCLKQNFCIRSRARIIR